MEATFEITFDVHYQIVDKRGRERRYHKSFKTPEAAIEFARAKDELCVLAVYKREHWETPYYVDPDGTAHNASSKAILTNIKWWK